MKSFKIWLLVGFLVATFVPLGGVVLAETADQAFAREALPKLEAIRTMLGVLQNENNNKLTIGSAIVAQLKIMIADQTGEVGATNIALLQNILPKVEALMVQFGDRQLKITSYQAVVNSIICQLQTILSISCGGSGSGGSGGGSGGGGGGGGDTVSISNVSVALTNNIWPSNELTVSKQVTWSSSGLGTALVSIDVCDSVTNSCLRSVYNTSTANDGTHLVTFPFTVAQAAGRSYYAKVIKDGDSSVFGVSANFSVPSPTAQPISNVSVALTNNAWPTSEFLSPKTVTWASSGLGTSNVSISFCDAVTNACLNSWGNTANDGIHSVTFPFTADQSAGRSYYAKVIKIGYPSVFGVSANFSVPSPTAQLISNISVALTNNIWPSNELTVSKQVTWSSSGLGTALVSIDVCDAVTNVCRESEPHIFNDGSEQIYFQFTAQESIGRSYYIKIFKTVDPTVFAKSSNFSVPSSVTPSISNVSVGGLVANTWSHGQTKTITWSSAGLSTSNVDIILCSEANLCSPAVMNTTNDGTQSMTLYSIDKPAGHYYIKVRKYNTESVSAKSSTFNLTSTTASADTTDQLSAVYISIDNLLFGISEYFLGN